MRAACYRLFIAALVYALVFSALAALHDYPQLRRHMHKVRLHDPIAEQRQWLGLFYLVNEAGSGIKFFLTGNERYMAHYPSASHLLAARTARALGGDRDAQLLLARMYYRGESAPRDLAASLQWLRAARDSTASEAQRQEIGGIIERVRTEMAGAAGSGS